MHKLVLTQRISLEYAYRTATIARLSGECIILKNIDRLRNLQRERLSRNLSKDEHVSED